MRAGFTLEELKKGVRNPFFEKLCRKVEVVVTHEQYAAFADAAKYNGERTTPEDIMSRCLGGYAQMLNDHESFDPII